MNLDTFILETHFPGKLIFTKVWGSWSHNTNLPDSDMDFLAVYQAPTKDVLSLNPPSDTIEGNKPDYQGHELSKFCRLLLKGNPGVVEMLFTEKMCYVAEAWQELKEQRKNFLSRKTVRQYLGYAEGQLNKLTKGSYLKTTGGRFNEKWAYHLIRLLMDTQRITKGEDPVLWKEEEERSTLMDIRTRATSQEYVVEMAKRLIKDIDDRKPWNLPEENDKEFLNDWMLRLRLQDLEK